MNVFFPQDLLDGRRLVWNSVREIEAHPMVGGPDEDPIFHVHTTEPNQYGASVQSGAEVWIGGTWIHIPEEEMAGSEEPRKGMTLHQALTHPCEAVRRAAAAWEREND